MRSIVILLALIFDLLLGDPPNRFHPLLLMGRWLSWGQRCAPARHRFWFGASWTLAGIGIFSLPWRWLEQRLPGSGKIVLAAALLKLLFAYRNLRQATLEVYRALAADDLPEARRLVGWHLVSRDVSDLTATEVAGATIESLAENLTDSVVAPLMAYAVGGLPVAWAYRFVNTADAMWGYRTPEMEQLGKFPARLDDALNWLPARLTGWLLVVAAWLVAADGRNAARTMLAQHGRTASLNAGWTMSAMAGALGVTLSKRGVYALTGGPAEPTAGDVRRALRVADVCVGLSTILLVMGSRVTR